MKLLARWAWVAVLGMALAAGEPRVLLPLLRQSEHVPWQAILSLPVLFTAGMALMDTTDGLFMNMAYGWAFFNPVRKVF